MYVVPILFIVLLALAIFFSPILALVLLVVSLVGLGIYKFLGPGTEPEHGAPPGEASPPAHGPGAGATARRQPDADKEGPWGEVWPERRSGEPS